MLKFRFVRKEYVAGLEAEVEKLRQTELGLRELIDEIARRNPEAQRIIGNLKIEEECQDKSSSEPIQNAPNGLPVILHPDLRIQYSVKFEKSFSSLVPTEKGSVTRSIKFLAENGMGHLGFKSIPMRRKMHGIDPHNCYMIRITNRKIVIIYQCVDGGIKFRDVFHEG